MARGAATAKLLHYPTPLSVMELIATSVAGTKDRWGGADSAILDPCASDGAAVCVLADRWELKAHGVELHPDRAQALADREGISVGLCGSYAQLRVGCDRPPYSVLFLNPPYDYARLDENTVERQELQFLAHCTQFLSIRGLLVFIPPASLLAREDFREYMAKNYTRIQCWKFPPAEFAAFSQVVILANRRSASWGAGNSDLTATFDLDRMRVLGDGEYTEYFSGVEEAEIKPYMLGVDPAAICPTYGQDATGVWGSRQWSLLTDSHGADGAPLVAPRPGHQAMLLAAGALNGCQVGRSLVKGGSDKCTEHTTAPDGTETYTERIVSHLSVLDLDTGAFDTWNVGADVAKTTEWFDRHKAGLADAIRASHTPAFDGDCGPYKAAIAALTPPGVLPGHTDPAWLEGQVKAACALAHRWKRHKNVILSGECGVGKTSCAVIAASLANWEKTVVVCPSHLVSKWVREVGTITGQACAMPAVNLSQVDQFFADPSMRFLILSKERAKLGARWEPAVWDAGRVLSVSVQNFGEGWQPYVNKRVVRKVASCPVCAAPVGTPDKRVKGVCEKCDEPLWQAIPISKRTKKNPKGTRRWPLASHIGDKYARRYSLVVDECHQYAGGTTDQSRAVQKLLSSARKTLMMTGTLYGGRATSIFHILYKCEPSFRQLYQFEEAKRFAEHHGLFERVYSEDQHSSIHGYKRGNAGGKVREIPGMSPAMIPMLLPYTVFVKLTDFEEDLPSYSEELVLVDPDPAVATAAGRMAQSVLSVLREYPQALGAYLQACLGYPDRADQSETIEAIIRDEFGEEIDRVVIANAPAIPDATYPKDDYVVKLATEEKAVGRGVLVYTTQNHRRDVRGRLRARLEAAGLRVVVLDSKVSPDKRETWIRKERSKGFDVMLTNGKLVETGLDLMWAHTIVQYGTEYSIHTLRQTLRRSWRLGQEKPIRVHILAQKQTMQAAAIRLIASKMRAAEQVDGDEAGGLAQVSTGGSNFLVELAQAALLDK